MLVVKGRTALRVVDLPSCEVSNPHELNAQVQDQNMSLKIFSPCNSSLKPRSSTYSSNSISPQRQYLRTMRLERRKTLAGIFSCASSDLRYIPLTQSPWPDFPESAVGCLFIIPVDDLIWKAKTWMCYICSRFTCIFLAISWKASAVFRGDTDTRTSLDIISHLKYLMNPIGHVSTHNRWACSHDDTRLTIAFVTYSDSR